MTEDPARPALIAPAPFVTTQSLRYCDTDAMGHVNNAVYAVMYEAGRAELVAGIGLLAPDGPHGVVIARLELDFLREMNWPGEVRIETIVQRIGAKSVHLRQRLLLGGELVSRAASVIAVIDRATRRAVPIDDAWRTAFAAWLLTEV